MLVTGHTGFKGSWLCHWLASMGAEVHGVALDPTTDPNMFGLTSVVDDLASDQRIDVRDGQKLAKALSETQPEIVFHLAAQPLVYEGYQFPQRTFDTNVLGTVNLLEGLRGCARLLAVVVVTTDKVYAVDSTGPAYTEDDPLGGMDPYSRSKAMAEGVVEVYRQLRSGAADPPWDRPIATVRAGNVIGGGDWAPGRLLPDCVRSFSRSEVVELRFPDAVRPWQHVMDPLCGYLLLAELLASPGGADYSCAWNFGPDQHEEATVLELASAVADAWDSSATVTIRSDERLRPPETAVLRLDSTKARTRLGWRPRWNLQCSIAHTVAWYSAWRFAEDLRELTRCQIRDYCGA